MGSATRPATTWPYSPRTTGSWWRGRCGCCGCPRDQVIRLRQEGSRRTHLPVDVPVTAELLLTEFVELQEVATREQLRTLTGHTGCPWTTRQLQAHTDDTDEARQRYLEEVLAKRVPVLTFLERFPAIELPLEAFLQMAGPIRPRFYSISSAPMVESSRLRLTVDVVEGPALAGDGEYRGMASRYLARLEPGDVFFGYVRVPAPPFHPPADPATPMILVGPGTGFAPLRGFLEERAAQQAAGAEVGLSKVFYGCRHPEHDWFYREEIAAVAAVRHRRAAPGLLRGAGPPVPVRAGRHHRRQRRDLDRARARRAHLRLR